MKLATKVRLAFVAKVTACLFAAFLFVSFTALFVVAPMHPTLHQAYEQQKLMQQIQRTSKTIDEVNEAMIRLHKLYRDLSRP